MASEESMLRGVITPLATPFTDGGQSVDEEVLRTLARDQVSAGVGALMVCGSLGEYRKLTPAERKRVLEVVVSAVGGSVPVIAHTTAATVAEEIELSRHAEGAGASWLMLAPPWDDFPSFREIAQNYRDVAAAVSLPILAYHWPPRPGTALRVDEILTLAEIDGVRGVKEGSCDEVLLQDLLIRCPEGFSIVQSGDAFTFSALAAGAMAVMPAVGNFLLEPVVELYDALCVKGDLARGRQVWLRLWPVVKFLEMHGFGPYTKAALAFAGYPVGQPRAPQLAVEGRELDEWTETLKAAGLRGVSA